MFWIGVITVKQLNTSVGFVMKPECPTGIIAFKRTCGHQQAVVMKCGSPLCAECERERIARIVERWTEPLEALPSLKLMTLTIRNGEEAAERLKVLDTSFRKLMDFRLGRTNLRRLKKRVFRFISQWEEKEIKTPEQAEQLRRSVESWFTYIERQEKLNGKSFKVRKLLKGLSSLEVTYDEDTKWHPHRHLIVSMRYMPQIILTVLWQWATEGQGQIVDIRAVKDIAGGLRETIKYTVKGLTIPEEKEEELLKALFRKKRVWVIGRIKPKPEDPKPCPGCERTDCNCKKVAVVTNATNAVINNTLYVATIYPDGSIIPETVMITIAHDTKRRLVWDIQPMTDALRLSLYSHRYQENSQQSQGPPSSNTGPPEQMALMEGNF